MGACCHSLNRETDTAEGAAWWCSNGAHKWELRQEEMTPETEAEGGSSEL